MRRFRREQGKISTSGWLLSYADMATILLALFIVVSVLSRDQTGSSFYRASGSYQQTVDRIGRPAHTSTPPVEQPVVLPYLRDLENPQENGRGDAEARKSWWEREGQEERLEQLLFELGRQHLVMRLPRQENQIIIDLYQPLNKGTPCLQARHQEALERLLPLLERPDYRVQVVVWATTPSPSAWARAAGQAHQACAELISSHQLAADVAGRLTGIGQTWPYRDIRRPVLSFVVIRTE